MKYTVMDQYQLIWNQDLDLALFLKVNQVKFLQVVPVFGKNYGMLLRLTLN